jgi:UDP-N-acetylmuramate dehydrogenase
LESTERSAFEESLRENVILAPMTTLGIGGPARFFARAESPEEIPVAVNWAASQKLPLFVLGGGSNIVVADDGFAGLVLQIDIKGVRSQRDGDQIKVTAGAGEEWDPFVADCVASGWAGLECLSGIPGRVGATPIQNVGAYGQETSETLARVSVFDRVESKSLDIEGSECGFDYRTSRFKTSDAGRFVVTSVTFALRLDGVPSVRYPELQKLLTDQGLYQPDLQHVRQAVTELRRRKAMVIDPLDPDSHSVGSFFVNPIVSQEDFENIRRCAGEETRGSMPAFPQRDGRVKLSAAWLIERAGIKRGFVRGNVGTSSKHALAIVNRGGGTARGVIELKNIIQDRVRREFGVELVPEPVFL